MASSEKKLWINTSTAAGRLFLNKQRAANPSRIVGHGYSHTGTFWGVLNVSLRANGAQLGSQLGYISQTVQGHGAPTDLSWCKKTSVDLQAASTDLL